MSGAGLSGDSLQAHLLRALLALDGVVLLHTVQMLESALGGEDVVHLDVDSLLDDAVSDLLVHLHTHSSLGHIEHHTRASMVTLEGHTLVDGTVGDDIDVVTILVASHVGGERNHSVLAEVSLEHVTSTGTITVSVRHCLQSVRDSILAKPLETVNQPPSSSLTRSVPTINGDRRDKSLTMKYLVR